MRHRLLIALLPAAALAVACSGARPTVEPAPSAGVVDSPAPGAETCATWTDTNTHSTTANPLRMRVDWVLRLYADHPPYDEPQLTPPVDATEAAAIAAGLDVYCGIYPDEDLRESLLEVRSCLWDTPATPGPTLVTPFTRPNPCRTAPPS